MKYYKLVKQIHTNHLLYVIISEDLRCYLKYYAYLCNINYNSYQEIRLFAQHISP